MLTDWDRRLLERHLRFYRDLHFGVRSPDTPAQRHFVDVCHGRASPRTQHEIAYMRYVRDNPAAEGMPPSRPSRHGRNDPVQHNTTAQDPIIHDKHAERVERTIDTIEAAEMSGKVGRATGRFLALVKEAYKTSGARTAAKVSEAALWWNAVTSDRDWSSLMVSTSPKIGQ